MNDFRFGMIVGALIAIITFALIEDSYKNSLVMSKDKKAVGIKTEYLLKHDIVEYNESGELYFVEEEK